VIDNDSCWTTAPHAADAEPNEWESAASTTALTGGTRSTDISARLHSTDPMPWCSSTIPDFSVQASFPHLKPSGFYHHFAFSNEEFQTWLLSNLNSY